jgi:hypothetical protein
MHNRWSMLALLFVVRATMAFQFQSVAAVAPILARDLGVGLADVGVLIGLYFAPGALLRCPVAPSDESSVIRQRWLPASV